jgi:dipeptide transport system ATP-binding protein
VIYLGKPVEQGDKEIFINQPLHPFTKALLAETPKVDKIESKHSEVVKRRVALPPSTTDGLRFS